MPPEFSALDAAMPSANFPSAAMPAISRPGALAEGAVAILTAAEPEEKVALSRAVAHAWNGGDLPIGRAEPPPRPARPPSPCLRAPRDMPKRRNFGSLSGRIALLHALAHIELNAIDLAWDIVARFAGAELAARVFRRLGRGRRRGGRAFFASRRPARGARRDLWRSAGA